VSSPAPLVRVREASGSRVGALCQLLQPWPRPLDRRERAAASLMGAARHDEELRAGLDEALVRPLSRTVRELAAREARRGRPLPESRVGLLESVLQALWWQRDTSFAAAPMTTDEVDQLVREALLPIIEPDAVAQV